MRSVSKTAPAAEQKSEKRLMQRLSGFISLIRPLFFILTPVNAGSAAVLALSGFPSIPLCTFGALAVALASCAINVFNDFMDRERDKVMAGASHSLR